MCIRLGPHLFAAYLMSTSSTRGLPGRSKTWHGASRRTRRRTYSGEHAEDLEASVLFLTASDKPPAISACLCPQQMLCPHPSTNQQATQPVTSQCSQISCDPIRACCRAVLRLRVKERQTEKEWARELRAGNLTRPEEVEWRETDKERDITNKPTFKKKSDA